MPTMVVRARFPLGTFLGHRGVGVVADFPDTARLHAALLHAAGSGGQAVERAGQLRPSAGSMAALEWLEQHPPFGLRHPPSVRVSLRPARTWRYAGTLEVRGGQPQARRELKSQSDAVAVAGAFEWGWRDVPAGVAETVAALCADVSCLGEADAPVQLSVSELDGWAPEVVLDPVQTGFPAPGGLRVRTPILGRVSELEDQYDRLYPSALPRPAADRHSWSALPGTAAPVAGSVRDLVYRSTEPPPVVPWPRALLVELDGEIDTTRSVGWAVAFHRALVARLPEPAPALITGRYPDRGSAPANRVALQLLGPTPLTVEPLLGAAVAVMVPAGASAADLAGLDAAVRAVSRVWGRHGDATVTGVRRLVDGAEFWRPVPAGFVRFWRPLPALVPEVRRQRGGDARWTLADAAALSAAYVFRDRFAAQLDGPGGRAGAVRAVAEAGFAIREIHPIRDSRLDLFAHKTPEGVTVQPYTGLVELGTLAPEGALLALGQSRHLGGGLLFPEDLPLPVARARGLLG